MSNDTHQYMPPYPLILEGLSRGLVIPFLGAGASLNRNATGQAAINIPTGIELANYLARKSQFPSGESIDLAKVAQYYSLIGGRIPLYRELHNIFDRDFPLGSIHKFLASIDHPILIVTTNYDDLVERAFLEQGRTFDVVIHTTDPDIGDRILWLEHGSKSPVEVSPNKLDIDLQKKSVIYKMHGGVDRHKPDRDQYVITEDDYVDFLVRMTKNRATPAIFAEPFQSSHFLFLGYSLKDWNLRVILNRIQNETRRPTDITSWAIQYKPSLMERKFWQNRRIEIYDMDLSEFIRELSKQADGKD